ncbi:MAG: hypothetical protein HKP48_07920 [Winogradskyella sp.]|uniref:DUF6705 family protein n=1 Tax=Winogradskyella sp. TaxID=1883156 RepID=UPI0017A15FC1|nr:DUF6705 family protein [Winogradskyella sp.]MBT8243925.1 hypothetical protein [Winogradskyella sp.]NNK23208.1 hypothetical protein [Winogradskyella sp.]
MKQILTLIIILFALSCKAQSPVISTVEYDQNDDLELTDGAYLKDVENKFNPFIGSWVWEDGNSRLEIVFEKIEMVFDGDYYEDMLVGRYKFIDNTGEEKHNSLNLNITNQNFWGKSYYLIRGGGYYTDTTFEFQISDLHKNVHCYMFFELISPTEATWKVQREDGRDQPGGFTFPTELTLTKQ